MVIGIFFCGIFFVRSFHFGMSTCGQLIYTTGVDLPSSHFSCHVIS